MNTKLITALRLTANALEQGTFAYKWSHLAQCNCGALFCALSGRSPAQLSKAAKPLHLTRDNGTGSWTELAGYWCPITGMTTQALFVELLGYGLTTLDITELEYLRNPEVLKRVGRGALNYRSATDAAAYMRAWANLLVERAREEGKLSPEPEPEPVQTPQPQPALPKRSLRERLLEALHL